MIFVAPFMLLIYSEIYVSIVGEGFIPEQLEIEQENRYIKAEEDFSEKTR